MSSGHEPPISFAAWTFMLEVEAFIEQLGEELEDGQLDRAWQITLGCVEVHAQVDFDEEEDETLGHAESLVWHDLWQAFESEPAQRYWYDATSMSMSPTHQRAPPGTGVVS